MRADLLEKIESVGKKDQKKALLEQFDTETIVLVGLALDPSVTFGVTVPDDGDGISLISSRFSERDFTMKFVNTLQRLRRRDVTGNAAITEVDEILVRSPTQLYLKWACRILNRELRAGFDISTYNKVFGGDESIKKFEVQLAEPYDPEKPLAGTWHVEPKLDGNRVILLDAKAWSRSGKQYQQCSEVIDGLLAVDPYFFEKYILDGEMMGDLGFDKSSGALRRLEGVKTAKFTYWVFDVIERNHWTSRKTNILSVRKSQLASMQKEIFDKIAGAPIQIVKHEITHSPTHVDIMNFVKKYVSLGFEGAMLKDVTSPYAFKRGSNVQKAKLFHDVDVPIVGLYEGKGRHVGRLGGIRVIFDGVETKVGSGFSDDLRTTVWNNKEDWIGAIAQIQYQDVGPKGGLRFPVFMMRRVDKE